MSYNIKFKIGQEVFLKQSLKKDRVKEIFIDRQGIFYKLENRMPLVNQNEISSKRYIVKVYDTQTGEEILSEETNEINCHREVDLQSFERDVINELLELDLR